MPVLFGRTSILAAAAAATAIAVSGSPPPAAAEQRRNRELAAIDVREVQSVRDANRVYRAIIAEKDRHPYLVVELIGPSRRWRQDRVLRQQRIDEAWLESSRRKIALYPHAQSITLRKWRKRGRSSQLRFDVQTTRGYHYRCQLTASPRQLSRVQCRSTAGYPGTQPVPPPVAQPNYAADSGVIRACGQAVYGPKNQSACLNAVANSRVHPARFIAACDTAVYGDKNTLACIKLGATARVDPSATIGACNTAMYGDKNTLACVRDARALGRNTGAIAACDQAMYGDKNTLSCIQVAGRIRRGDPSRVIRSCDTSMTGDRATLACLQSAAGR